MTPEALSNPNSTSYTALLLEDIHNFHQKNTPPPPAAFSLPPCVTKACSILEAVADLNSSTGSNLSSTELRRNPSEQLRKVKQEPIVESEIVGGGDDLMQPSFHKYVTVRRGAGDGDLEEEESSGSNSFVGSGQQWASSSCWEPNSAESTDRWMSSSSSRSTTRQNREEGGKKTSAAKSGIGKGRSGSRASHTVAAAVASST